MRDPVGTLDVLSPDPRRQAIARVIGNVDRFDLVAKRYHRQHRAEDLFLSDPHVIADPGQDSRLDEVAVAQAGVVGRTTAADHLGALLLANPDVHLNLVKLFLKRDRSHLRLWLQGIAKLDGFGPRA